ncbi:MAG: hypothetical protein LBT11_04935 [Treponema sp.]|nr:hypothetical protein [Treponema sp.]
MGAKPGRRLGGFTAALLYGARLYTALCAALLYAALLCAAQPCAAQELAPGLAPGLPGADERSLALDMFLIIDGSMALAAGRTEALNWVCDTVVDGMLRAGDRVIVWAAGEKAREIFSGKIAGQDSLDTLKALIRGIGARETGADFAGALREAAAREAAVQAAGGMSYTLLVAGAGPGQSSLLRGTEDLLRYSRVREFPQWRAMVSLGSISSAVGRAAASFFYGQE